MTKGNRYPCPRCKDRLTMEGCGCVTCDACGYVDAAKCACEKPEPLAVVEGRIAPEDLEDVLAVMKGSMWDDDDPECIEAAIPVTATIYPRKPDGDAH